MPVIDYESARKILEAEFSRVEAETIEGKTRDLAKRQRRHFDSIFQSQTQAYREVLVGCILARLCDRSIDIHKPYVNQGDDAYNGRTLDERTVNPFLHEKRIPASKGPFLAAFRRSVMFDKNTREGMRDKSGYDSLLALIDSVADINSEKELKDLLRYLLFRFICLRTAADVPLSKLRRISLEQYGSLIEALLSTPSGGRFPVMLVEATFSAIKKTYTLPWAIEVQGINVADRAAGVGGDIVIRKDGTVVLAVEVTERPVEKSRVMSTFQTKIAPQGIEDYLFLVRGQTDDEAMQQARQYFSQGHEVNFLQITEWMLMILATIGKEGRSIFNNLLIEKLNAADIPATLKVAWNKNIERITNTE
jgi:hypothetical protein